MKSFEFLEHTADIKIKASGKSLNSLFQNCITALSSYLSDKKALQKIKKEITLKAEDEKSLLYTLLDEIIYLIDAEDFIVSKAKIKIEKKLTNCRIIRRQSIKIQNKPS